jgi:4,5-DOPA dioxygenase extradiol
MTPSHGKERLMPAAFIGHGSPMNALELNRYTEAWRSFGRCLPRPRAILVVSAHWYINATAVTAMARPRTIHDFFGFPKALPEVEYPAPGDLRFAEEVADVAKPTRVGLDHDSWGIGVLIIGSGNVVHNLRELDWSARDLGFDWARRFDEAARAILTERAGEAAGLQSHDEFARAAPTPEHFIPLLYVAGLASVANRPAHVLIDGYAFGSLSTSSSGHSSAWARRSGSSSCTNEGLCRGG